MIISRGLHRKYEFCQENMPKKVTLWSGILGEKNGAKGGDDCLDVGKGLNKQSIWVVQMVYTTCSDNPLPPIEII